MKLIQDLGMQFATEKSTKKVRLGIYQCPICLSHFKTRTADVKNKKSTKCLKCKQSISKNKTHGDSKTRLYNTWCGMIARVENKNDIKNYKDYGERGISICTEWRSSFIEFKKWALENGYKDNLKIDRIDNNGNYEPSNCRWVEQNIQSRNTRRLRSTNTSGYRGVSWHKRQNKFNSRILVDGKMINLGSFIDKIEAAKAYDKYVIDNNLEHTTNGLIHKGSILNVEPVIHTLALEKMISL